MIAAGHVTRLEDGALVDDAIAGPDEAPPADPAAAAAHQAAYELTFGLLEQVWAALAAGAQNVGAQTAA